MTDSFHTCPGGWCSLVVCDSCGEMMNRRQDGSYRCSSHQSAGPVVVWRDDCPHQPHLTEAEENRRKWMTEMRDELRKADVARIRAEDRLTEHEVFARGEWATWNRDIAATVVAQIEMRALDGRHAPSAPSPSVERQAETAHLALRYHLQEAAEMIRKMCPFMDIDGRTKVSFDSPDEPDTKIEITRTKDGEPTGFRKVRK